MPSQSVHRSAIQWQASLIRGFGQYFIEIMEGSDENDWGPVLSIWNILMIVLFGFLTKKIYDTFGVGDDKTTKKEVQGSEKSTEKSGSTEQGSGSTSKESVDTLQGTDGSGESLLRSADGSKISAPSRVEDIHKTSQDKQGAGLSKDGAGKPLGAGDGSSVDGAGGSSSGQKGFGARER